MRTHVALVSFLIIFIVCARGDQTDDYIQKQMREHRIPGVALTIIKDGKQVRTATYGVANIEQNALVKPETVFEIGSITKQFTAAGILLLAQDGKLMLDDKLGMHIKEIPAAWTNITLRHLMSHTSGLKNYTGLPGFELTRHLTQQQFIERLGKEPLDFQPGASWKYCNSGFNLLGFVIENVSGKNYWSFMQERIFQRLGMNATTDRLPMNIIANRAAGYEQTNHIWINRDYDLTDVFSAGAIVSTVGDLAKWNGALDGNELLKAGSKEQMWTPAKLNDGKATKYGLGWFIEDFEEHKVIGHSGSTSGFSASIQRFPKEHLAVIVLTNTDEQIATALARKVAGFYFER